MFRKHETTIAWKAGWLALLVHVLLLGALLFSFNWKAAHTVVSVSDVELWSELPSKTNPAPMPPVIPKPVIPKEEPKPEPPEPEVKEEPEPQPEVKEEPKPEPEPKPEEPKVDIELENKKKAEEEKKRLEEKKKIEKKKKLAEKKKKEKLKREKLKKIQEAAFDDEVEDENEKRLKDLQQEVSKVNRGQPSGPSKGEMDKYIARISAKIRGNVNSSLCGDGKPLLTIKIKMLPTGEFSSTPTVTKSNGTAACDAAVERAAIVSEPLPLPTDPAALAKFRDLNLNFYPNGK
ncbi:MAG: TonB C-terminal domain-containing protein [Methylophilaceae bacterium]